MPAIAPVLLHERPLAPHCPLIQRLQAGDAEVVEEPTEQPYGIRDCAPRDQAGNLIRIQELR